MFHVVCLECGETDRGTVSVEKHEKGTGTTTPRNTISQSCTTTLECTACDTTEQIHTGVLPVAKSDHFDKRDYTDDDALVATVSGQRIHFSGIDESYSYDSHYTGSGVRGNSSVHHIHIHASDPPTISKGAHRVVVGEFVNETMRLGDVRYHESGARTLKFYRRLTDSQTAERRARPNLPS